jgi:mannose-6-phosphate isomerase
VKPEPFRIEPTFVPRIWGARSLAPLYPEKSNLPEPIGEAWLTGIDCKVVSGPFAGKTLGEAWREMPHEWRGARFTEPGDFPILIKFIFPSDKLSIQVHPDDAYAAAHEQAAGGQGKTEMWHVVQAEPGANVLLGTKPGVTKELVVDAIAHNTLENLMEKHPVYNGDTFFVPAGTPHTIGSGMILCEVQEYSDLTYRLYDYGRTDAKGNPRELHVKKALDVMKFGKTAGRKTKPVSLFAGETGDKRDMQLGYGGKRTLLSACRYFAVERWEFYRKIFGFRWRGSAFDILVVLNGKGEIGWGRTVWKRGHDVRDWGCSGFQAGQCWFVPALLNAAPRTSRHATMLRVYVPEDLSVLRSALKRERHSEAAIAETVFD